MNRVIQSLSSIFKTFLFCGAFIISSYSGVAHSASPLNINLASAEELAAVMNGVGANKANAIVEYRNEHGDFSSLDELIFVKGIGPSVLEKNREMLSIGEAEAYEQQSLEELSL